MEYVEAIRASGDFIGNFHKDYRVIQTYLIDLLVSLIIIQVVSFEVEHTCDSCLFENRGKDRKTVGMSQQLEVIFC